MSKDLGKSTSYAYYVAEGGTKTPQEYGEMLVNIDTVATRAEDAADSAAESATGALNSKNAAQTAATTATNKASEATTAATTATNKAAEAQADADAAALDASQALSAASTATTKATEATTAAATATSAATTATTAKDDAVSAKTAAQTAQTGAETAAASVEASAEQIATNTADISQLKSNIDEIAPIAIKTTNVSPSTQGVTSIGHYRVSYDGSLAEDQTYTGFKYEIHKNGAIYFNSFRNNSYAILGVYSGEPSASTFINRYHGLSPSDIGTVSVTAGQVVVFTGVPQSTPSNLTFVYEYETRSSENADGSVYVATDGNDNNLGSFTQPFKTVAKALSVSKNVIIKSGTYSEQITVSNENGISIIADPNRSDNSDVVFDFNDSVAVGFLFENIVGLHLAGITIKKTTENVCNIHNCSDVTVQECQFSYGGAEGLSLDGSNAIITSCIADHNSNDGFNIHGHGNTCFYDCSGYNNGGDGLSHHNACTGYVCGGYWHDNTKAGIATPTYGAVVNISNVFVYNNQFGMQVYGDTYVVENAVHIKIDCGVFKGNTYGIQVNKYAVDLVNCVFTGNGQDKLVESGSVTEY